MEVYAEEGPPPFMSLGKLIGFKPKKKAASGDSFIEPEMLTKFAEAMGMGGPMVAPVIPEPVQLGPEAYK